MKPLLIALLLTACTVEEVTTYRSTYHSTTGGLRVFQVDCHGECCNIFMQPTDGGNGVILTRGSYLPEGTYSWVQTSSKQSKDKTYSECKTSYGG